LKIESDQKAIHFAKWSSKFLYSGTMDMKNLGFNPLKSNSRH